MRTGPDPGPQNGAPLSTAPEVRTPVLDEASDALLAGRAADGDARAFAVLVRRHGGLLRGYARRVLGSAASSADDVVQEALITAWQQLPQLQDHSAVRSWLVRVTSRKAVDLLRGLKHHDDVDDVDAPAAEGAGPESMADASALAGSLHAALDALPEQQRQAWTMRELGGLSYEEVAEELGVPVSTVRGLLARARTTLMARLDDWR